jgi:hypothetical protein
LLVFLLAIGQVHGRIGTRHAVGGFSQLFCQAAGTRIVRIVPVCTNSDRIANARAVSWAKEWKWVLIKLHGTINGCWRDSATHAGC